VNIDITPLEIQAILNVGVVVQVTVCFADFLASSAGRVRLAVFLLVVVTVNAWANTERFTVTESWLRAIGYSVTIAVCIFGLAAINAHRRRRRGLTAADTPSTPTDRGP